MSYGTSTLSPDIGNVALYATVSPRVQRIKDISVTKKILNDLTSSEFALKVEVKNDDTKIDYEMLITNLDKHVDFINKYKSDMYEGLLQRISRTKSELREALEARKLRSNNDTEVSSWNSKLITPPPKFPEGKGFRENIPSLRVFVRDDGTVDWEETLASGKEVARFGSELWERLNGKDAKDDQTTLSFAEVFGQKQAKQPDTQETMRLAAEVRSTLEMLTAAEQQRDLVRSELRKV